MPDFERLYMMLFGAIADAVEAMEEQNYGVAREGLIRAMQDAEEEYIKE